MLSKRLRVNYKVGLCSKCIYLIRQTVQVLLIVKIGANIENYADFSFNLN